MNKELKDKLNNLREKDEKYIPETLEPKNTIQFIKQMFNK